MFDQLAIDELDDTHAADELARVRRELLAAEGKQFALAAHWADLHAQDYVADVQAQLPGTPRLVPLRGCATLEGCPQIEEYAGAELAALLGRSTVAGEQLIADAVVVRHRHRLLWAGIREGVVSVWVARQVARRCVTARLSAAQAEWVDAQTTPYVQTLPTKRFLDLVDAKIIEADPEAAEERARARSLERFVHAGRTDDYGLRTLVARATAGDVTYLVAVLDRIAVILAERGDPRPREVLRAEALRVLGNPARALALLTEATLQRLDPDVETLDEVHKEMLSPGGDAGWMRDARGRPLPGAPDLADLPLLDLEELAGLPEYAAVTAVAAPGPADKSTETGPDTDVEEHADPALLTALLAALEGFDAAKLDPLTVLHVHLSEGALTARAGVTRVEELGPVVLGEVRDWLVHPFNPDQIRSQVRVRPVLDAEAVIPVDRYEVPGPMSELGTCRTPFEVFPYGTLASRRADNDHAVPYRSTGPPGQTRVDNLAKLGRFHHRLKTNGGWTLRHPDPGTYWWRTPHGHWFRVDADGTHAHGRDAGLDARWLDEQAAA